MMASVVPPKQAAKAWTVAAGTVVTSLLFELNQYAQYIPAEYAPWVLLVTGALTSVATFLVPNAAPPPASPTPAQVEESRADTPAQGWKPPWPKP